MTCSGDELYSEMAYVAYHFHWPYGEILDLEHAVRRRFIGEIGRLEQGRAGR